MSNNEIFKKYEIKEALSMGTYGKIYKGINKETGNYIVIKEILKTKYYSMNNSLFNAIECMKKMKTNININETIDTKEYFYIIMDFCFCNLEEYLKIKKDGLSIKEIQQILIQLNEYLILIKDEIILKDLKPSDILLSIDSIDKINFKLSKFVSNKQNKRNSNKDINNSLTISPEILKGNKKFSNKTDLWSLGVIIYYMLFKEYPFNGKVEYQIIKDIESNKQLKEIKDEDLKDLVHKMLSINENERISWEDYFNHSFFKKVFPKKRIEFPQFDFVCKKHLDYFNYYCTKCKCNICEKCKNEHGTHQIISFSEIGLNDLELEETENLLKEIEDNLKSLNNIKSNIENIMNKIKTINENNEIYKNDSKSNYKKYYINCLKFINEEIKIRDNVNYIELEDTNIKINNCIECEYKIEQEIFQTDLKRRILNCYEESKKENPFLEGIENEKQIKDNCELYLNDKKLDFCFEYEFENEGNLMITINYKKLLINTNFMFNNCLSLTYLNSIMIML